MKSFSLNLPPWSSTERRWHQSQPCDLHKHTVSQHTQTQVKPSECDRGWCRVNKAGITGITEQTRLIWDRPPCVCWTSAPDVWDYLLKRRTWATDFTPGPKHMLLEFTALNMESHRKDKKTWQNTNGVKQPLTVTILQNMVLAMIRGSHVCFLSYSIYIYKANKCLKQY